MLQIFGHAHLSHQSILIPRHASQVAYVGEDILQAIGKLESFDVAKPVLNVRVNDQFDHPEDLSAEMEGIAEPTFFALFRRQRLDWLQVEVVVKMQIVQVLAMYQQVEHIVALSAHLKARLHPVKFSELEELGCLDRLE